MLKREFALVVSLMAALMMLLSACAAAKPLAEAALRADLPCGPSVEADGSVQPVPIPDNSVPTEDEIGELLSGSPSTDFDPSQPVLVLDDRGLGLVLGPAWPIEIEKATPQELAPGSCQFDVSLSDPGLETFNTVAQLCFERTERCPTGQLAVVVEGELIWAPTIQSPRFDQPQFTISSQTPRTPQESLDLAEALVGPTTQFRPVILDPNAA